MKKLVSTLMILSIVTSSNIYAAEIPKANDLKKSSEAIEAVLKAEKKLSLSNAMKLAEIKVTKDPLYTEKLKELNKIQEDNIERYGEPERKIDDSGKAYYKYPYGEPSYNLTQQIYDLEDSLENSIESARDNVKSLYFNIVEVKQNLEIAKNKVDIATDELEKTKLKYSLGTITQAEVVSKEANLSSSKANYESSKGSLTSLYNKFELLTDISKVYGLNADSIIYDVSSLIAYTTENIIDSYVVPSNLDKKTKDLYKELADLKEKLDDKEEALKKIADGYDENSVYYYNKSEELGIRVLKDEIEDAERALNVDFSADSQKLTNSIESFQVDKNSFDLSKKRYEQMLVKYNAGQVKKTDFLKEKLNYDESKLNYENSLKNVYILVDNYNEKYSLEREE